MSHLFYFLSSSIVYICFSKWNCTFPSKSLFDKLSAKSSLCCLHVGGESDNSKTQGFLWLRKKRKLESRQKSTAAMCHVQLLKLKKILMGFFKFFPFSFRFYFCFTPPWYTRCGLPISLPLPLVSTLLPIHLCCRLITYAPVNHPVVLMKRLSYEVPLICKEHHWTWPCGEKKSPDRECVNKRAKLTDVQPYRSVGGGLWEVDLFQLNTLGASTCWQAEYQPHRHHHQNNYSHLHHKSSCPWHCSLNLLVSASFLLRRFPFFAFVSRETHSPFRIPHSVSFWACLFLLLSLQTGDSPCLVFALLAIAVVLITKGDHPLSSSAQSALLSPHWLMSLRRGMSPSWQLLLNRNILMAPLPTKMLRVAQPVPPTLPIPWRSLLLFLKCQRHSWIGQDNKHLNKALSLINERRRGLGRPLSASHR